MPAFLRQLQRRPTLSLAIIVTMACGIALNVAVFTVVNAVLLEPLPFPEPDRLVLVASVRAEEPARMRTVSLNDLADWSARLRSFETLAAWRDWGYRMRTPQGLVSAYGVIVTPQLFTVLPVTPMTGRLFLDDEDRPGRNQVVLISERLWRERFASNPAIVGSTVNLVRAPAGEVPFTVIGVLPTDIGVPTFSDVDIWALSSTDVDAGARRELRNRRVFGRLRAGVSLQEANSELEVVARGLAQAYPASNAGWTARAVPLAEWVVGSTRAILLAFFVAVGSVVLIACANVAGVLLASTAARRREFAVRLALGATRRRITAQVLGESVAIALVAGGIAMLLSGWLVRGLLALGPTIPRADAHMIDWRVFLFAALLSIGCGVLFGIVPALRETHADVADALRADRSGTAGAKSARLRAVLVAGQVAVALVLVAAAAAASRTVVDLLRVNPGFDPRGLVVFSVAPSSDTYPTGPDVARAYQRIQEDLSTIPGATAVSSVSGGPLFGGEEDIRYTVVGDGRNDTRRTVLFHNVTPNYFSTLRISLREGRDLSWRDTPSSPLVAVVNEAWVRAAVRGGSPLGRQVATELGTFTVVGVIGDVAKRLEPGATAQPEIYFPYSQRARWMTYVVIRTTSAGDRTQMLSHVRDRLSRIDPDFTPLGVRTMEEMIAREHRGPQFVALLFGVFAGVAMLLSVVGVYGLVAYTLAQRTREIGIRLSLGATVRDVLRVTVGSASVAVLAGAAIGVAGAVVARQALASAVPSLAVMDAAQIAGVAALLALGGIAAAYLPARRALRIDPVRTLRDD